MQIEVIEKEIGNYWLVRVELLKEQLAGTSFKSDESKEFSPLNKNNHIADEIRRTNSVKARNRAEGELVRTVADVLLFVHLLD